MTDRVDLDALDVGDKDEKEGPRRGDWFWHGEGDAADEPMGDEPANDESAADDATDAGTVEAEALAPDADAGSEDESVEGAPGSETTSTDGSAAASARTRVPHVPRENENKPVGIPVEGGGAGGVSARGAAGADRVSEENNGDADDAAPDADVAPDTDDSSKAAPSAMTMAFSYNSLKRLASPILVLANAAEWTDWIGVVGDVDAYVINKFVREEGLDIDFFNGAGTTPTERLREISTNPNSMFAAERKVLVGLDADRGIVDRTDWEFVPLTEAAEAAGWDLDEPEE